LAVTGHDQKASLGTVSCFRWYRNTCFQTSMSVFSNIFVLW